MTWRRIFGFFGVVLLVAIAFQAATALLGPQPSWAAPPPVTVQLTTDPAADVRPAWSPDGKTVAFQTTRADGSNFHIWVMDVDGRNQRAITRGPSDDRHPFWSPDSKQIAFDSGSDGTREIRVINSNGGNPRQVTRLNQESIFPAWSPDGKQITFFVYTDGVLGLWVVGADGSNPRPLVPTVARQQQNQCAFPCHQALWSGDGKKIAYGGGDRRSIWVINADGSDATQVAKRSGTEPQHFPWWLRDGRLGFIVERVTTAASWTEAWAVQLPQGAPALFQDKIAHQGPLQWSPDESKVLFHSPRSGNFDIYAIDLKAPGGIEALQGSPSAEAAPAAAAPGPPLAEGTAAILAGLILVAGASAVALAVLLRRQRRPSS